MAKLTKREQVSLDKKIAIISDKCKEAVTLTKEIKSNHRKYTNVIPQLENILTQASDLTKQYKINEKKIKAKLEKAENFYNKTFLPIKDKIDDKQTGLRKSTQEGERFLKEIEIKRSKLKTSNNLYSANISELNNILSKAKKIDKSTTSTSISIDKTKVKTNQLLEDAKSVLSKIDDHLKQTSTLNKDINILLSSSNKLNVEIEGIKDNAVSLNDHIKVIEDEAISTNDKITKVYEIVANKALAGAFDKRRKELSNILGEWNNKVRFWSICLFLAVLVLLFVQIGFNKWEIDGLGYDFYLRFLFAGPILYYLLFCNTQYNHIRKSLEKYTFTTTIASSVEAHTDLLSKKFNNDEHKEKILKFLLDSLNKIYDKPYHDELGLAKIKNDKKKIAKEPIEQLIEKALRSKNNESLKELKDILQLINDNKNI